MDLKYYLSHPSSTFVKIQQRMTDQLVQKNVLKGHRDYVKFIILGWYRTGSNLLVTSLNSHPQAIAYSEVFFPKRIFWGNGVYGKKDASGLLAERSADAAVFIENHVFRQYPRQIEAVGFKIFYPQIEHASHQNLSQYLFCDTSLRIVHLRRRNLLRVLVSSKVAQQTGMMTEVSQQRAATASKATEPLELSYSECSDYFNHLSEKSNQYDLEFKQSGHLVLNLYYEDLIHDLQLMDELQRFLGLEPINLSSRLVKQNTRRPSEIVKNYEELKHSFTGTQWEVFFE